MSTNQAIACEKEGNKNIERSLSIPFYLILDFVFIADANSSAYASLIFGTGQVPEERVSAPIWAARKLRLFTSFYMPFSVNRSTFRPVVYLQKNDKEIFLVDEALALVRRWIEYKWKEDSTCAGCCLLYHLIYFNACSRRWSHWCRFVPLLTRHVQPCGQHRYL